MRPPPRTSNYERVGVYDDWITGKIIDIEYDMEHKRMWKGEEKVGPAVRFKFELEGCKFPHRTAWLSFLYTEKATLYQKYLLSLVEEAKPDMDFDLDLLRGMEIKTIWSANGEYDNLEMIRPLGKKVPAGAASPEGSPPASSEPDEDAGVPF